MWGQSGVYVVSMWVLCGFYVGSMWGQNPCSGESLFVMRFAGFEYMLENIVTNGTYRKGIVYGP